MFSVAALIGRISYYLPGLLIYIVFAEVARNDAAKKSPLQSLLITGGLTTLSGGVFVVFISLFPKFFITLLFGAHYVEAGNLTIVKRTLLYAEYFAEDLLLDLPHRQFVFTFPKILRPYFKSDKRLFGEVSRLIFSLLSNFFSLAAGRPLLCACVVSYQSFGEFARFHPHWHVLILEGGFTRFDRFVYLPIGADEGMLKVWQASILALFLRKELIDQARVNMLKDWEHSGFSIESETRLLSKADREALGQYVVRGAICAEKIHYDPASDTVIWTAAPKGFYKGKTETFKGFEFVDQLVAHVPPRRVQLVRRDGVYAGKVRKQWQERPTIYRLSPESWQKGHPSQSQIVQSTPPEKPESVQAPDAWSKLRKQSWARLLQKVYEVDPFI